jgi:SAM-dependent methyltransferase
MRAAELAPAMNLLRPAQDVLELGAGDGWQSHAMSQVGFHMTAVDVDEARVGPAPAYPVTIYDGLSLPFADGSFDAIYSSNVLEHIVAFDRVQDELKRVLRPGGFAVHCVPSGVWRAWTTIGHPIYALKAFSGILAGQGQQKQLLRAHLDRSTSPQTKLKRLLRLALVSPRHGEHGSLAGEHILFTRKGWIQRFERSGWSIRMVEASGVFYSGNEIWGTRFSEATRRGLARIFGSSSTIFTVTPKD